MHDLNTSYLPNTHLFIIASRHTPQGDCPIVNVIQLIALKDRKMWEFLLSRFFDVGLNTLKELNDIEKFRHIDELNEYLSLR